MPDQRGRPLGATFVALFVVALLLFFAAQILKVLFLLFLAALLAIYLSAVTDWLVPRTRLPRGGALTIAVVSTLLISVGIGALILPPLIEQTQELMSSLPAQISRLQTLLTRAARQYPLLERTAFGLEGGGFIEGLIRDTGAFVRGSFVPYLTAGGALAVEFVSVFAMALYMSRDPDTYREGLILLLPPQVRHIARTTLADLANTMRAWVGAQLLAMTVLAALTAAGLWILQVPYALAFGVFTGVVAIVPFFGTMVSTLLPAVFVLVNGGWLHALAVVLLGLAIHLIEANVVAPLIFQQHIRLPPVFTILSVLIMASLVGILGLIIAVPLLAAVMVVVRHVLIGEIYRETPRGRVTSAVLVHTTGERSAVILPEERPSGAAPAPSHS